MEERMVQFITALRAAGVRVSLAESADAFRAVEQLGVTERDTFRLSLRATLVKDANSIPVFEELFPLFFGMSEVPSTQDLMGQLTDDEAGQLAEALRQLSRRLRESLQRLMEGQPLSEEELRRLGNMVGLDHADDLRYRDWMARRMQQALGLPQVQQALRELIEMLAEMGMDAQTMDKIRQAVEQNKGALAEQLRQYAGERIAENLSNVPPDAGIEHLFNRPFRSLSDQEMDRLRKEVGKLASLLRSRIALRQKRAKSGTLDPKATIRANLKHNSVPIQLKHKDHHLKPRIVVICDISTSMRYCSELMLSLIYALQDRVNRTHAFAFIDHLEYISPDLTGKQSNEAVQSVLDRLPAGYYNTDLGNSLHDFDRDFLDTLDRKTSFIIVGDGRNNYNDPRLDLFRKLGRRSRTTLWLNPESPGQWGSGDSDMLQYAPLCNSVLKVSNLAELTQAIDKLFIH